MFTIASFINQLCALGSRQGKTETLAKKHIINILQKNSVPFLLQEFTTLIPDYKHSRLTADRKTILAEPCCFTSGTITNKSNIISSLISSQKNLIDPNINFNPKCDLISRSNHYFAPAFAIARRDLKDILNAKQVTGVVRVKKLHHRSANILIGNIHNPRSIVFTHYDSLGPGACDNASGVAAVITAITNQPQLLVTSLFVIAGNEEISFDFPVYWGHGYRIFEQKYNNLLKKTKKIIVIDSVGIGKTVRVKGKKLLSLGFPLVAIKQLAQKTSMITGDFGKLMAVYHSEGDIPEVLDMNEVDNAAQFIIKSLKYSISKG